MEHIAVLVEKGVIMLLNQELELTRQMDLEEELKSDFEEIIFHGILVSNLAFQLSKELKLSDTACYEMAEAGMVHDIGKLKLGQYLYGRRKDTLKIEELKYVRLHPQLGYDALVEKGIYSKNILESVYYHHENFDGTGYPNNLKGEAIPYGARILRTCDVFSALVSNRPYRAAFEVDAAIELMIDEVKNFDMGIFLAFMKQVHSEEFIHIREYINEINKKNKKDQQYKLHA